MSDPFKDVVLAASLAQAIVDTVREPLLVLDSDLRVVAASRSFYKTFHLMPQFVIGQLIYDIVDGRFNVPDLKNILEKIVPDNKVMNGFEIEADFPVIGQRILILNARQVFYENSEDRTLLLALEDITERRIHEREKAVLLKRTEDLLRQKDILLEEMQHRVANSLQIIASILMLKSRSVTSEETRQHLQDAHRRVISVATVQQHIHGAGRGEQIEVGPYLTKLCDSLAASMIADQSAISIKVQCDKGTVSSDQAVSFGLIVTELVINALKYAFPQNRPDSQVLISYETNGTNWRLVVSDNGVGKPDDNGVAVKGGLGTSLVKALAQQFDATVESTSTPKGMRVAITRATFDSRLPKAA